MYSLSCIMSILLRFLKNIENIKTRFIVDYRVDLFNRRSHVNFVIKTIVSRINFKVASTVFVND